MICIVNFKTLMDFELQLKWLNDIANEEINFKLLIAPTLPLKNTHNNYEIISQNIAGLTRTVGEISGSVLQYENIKYAIIGHLERRKILNEDSAIINQRLKSCFAFDITPIICLGMHSGPDLVVRELKSIVKNVELTNRNIIIVYESKKSTLNGQAEYSFIEMQAVLKYLKEYITSLNKKHKGPRSVKYIMGGHVDEIGVQVANRLGYDGVLIGDRYKTVEAIEPVLVELNKLQKA
ncbi:MAG: triose-phosphate isomerase [Lactobacillaceae bacterium]|jgi:triosephosphate isomerase|nr:triose-phosphate isomerase [Lactobacillaceae bacterium]